MDYTDINFCIQILNEKPRWFFQKDNTAKKLKCFDIIQKLGTPSTIYSITNFLKSSNTLIREKSAETILQLFSKLKSLNDYAGSLKHLNIATKDLDFYRVDFDEKTYLRLLGIASLNRNGYVREKAIMELARLKNKDGLKFILLRLSDWVLPVRKAATDALNSFFDNTYIDVLLTQLSTIDWLLNVKRVDLTETHNRIIQFILNQKFSDELHNRIKQLDDKTRLRYYKNLFKYTKPSQEQTNRIVKDKSFLVRLEVIKHLSLFNAEFQKEAITRFLQDQSARIRVNALYATKSYSHDFDTQINVLLSDESASVRQLCRFLLKSEGFDFPKIYRERITHGKFLSGSLIGLSEVGKIEDLKIFEKHINSNNPKIIIGCLTAINRVNSDKAKNYSLELLTYPVLKVRNRVIEILAKGCDIATLEKVRQTYNVGNYEIKKTILKLYNKIGGWNVIGDLLIALTEEDSKIQNIGWQLIEKWKAKATRLFTIPPKREIERANDIYKSLDRSKAQLTYSRINILEDLKFYLK